MRDKFRLLIHESTGQKYEDLFVKIMRYADTSFQPVKAHGNIGDRGNDGFNKNTGRYYQVYAPENLPSNTKSSIQKMKNDFNKLLSFWNKICPIKEYCFVVNDKYKGVSPHIYEVLYELKIKHNLRDTSILLAQNLEEIFFSLKPNIINSIISTNYNEINRKDFYEYLVDEITNKMHLRYWPTISEKLSASSIENFIVNCFSEVTTIIYKTAFPRTIISLESSIQVLANRIDALILHFTNSKLTFLVDNNKSWCKDMRWKKEWINDQNEYKRKYKEYDKWDDQLYILHYDLVHALNLFAKEVRNHIDPNYFMCQQFTIVDTLSRYNGLVGYEVIPNNFK